MLRLLLSAVLLACASTVLAQALRLSVAQPRQAYAVGEEVVFRVESELRGALTYELGYSERAGLFETGAIDYAGGVAEIRYRPMVACFLYVRVRLGGQSADLGVAVGLDDIRALTAEPADFDAFWAGQRALLAEVPIDTRLEFIDETEFSTRYRFSAGSVDGRRVYGYIVMPKGPGPKPAALRLPPFSQAANLTQPFQRVSEKGNLISVSITIHDAPVEQVDPNAYQPNDLRDRERIYYRYAVLAAVRAIDVIAAMPEWDRTHLLLWGESQGGGLALLTAGVDARVTNVIQSVAALSQHGGATVGQASGFPYYLEVAEDAHGPEGLSSARTAVQYYEALFGARRFRGPSMHFVNYKDPVCPPATHYAAVNEMTGPRVVLHSLDLYHGSPAEFEETFLEYLRTHVPAASDPPFFYESKHRGYRITAGADQDLGAGAVAQLSGDAGYDGAAPGADWMVRWRQLDGPGAVTLGNPGALATSATFSAAGTYRLRLEVTAPHRSDARKYYELLDDVTVVVGSGGTSAGTEVAAVRDVRVFPNPARGVLHVEAVAQADLIGVSLRDLLGREVLHGGEVAAVPGQTLRQTLRTEGLAAGAYVLVLRGRGGIHRTPVVVGE